MYEYINFIYDHLLIIVITLYTINFALFVFYKMLKFQYFVDY